MSRLQNKTALITGGTSGIGFTTARRFLEEGARVAITGANPDRLAQAAKDLGSNVTPIHVDAGDVRSQRSVADTIASTFGKLDILFANAGVGDFRPLKDWDEAGFDRSVAVNVKGMFFLVQALLPAFNNPASIVLNASINAHIGAPTSSVYALTKAAVRSLARTLSGELIGQGIRVNAISAGPIATPLYDKLGMGEKERAGLIAHVPAGRMGTPEEYAEAVVYFASDAAAFAVGSELVIDGGMSTL
jgi:NAD(P)-dependent dehydrogenase (short-subunit alcohol dehydrogenase family)